MTALHTNFTFRSATGRVHQVFMPAGTQATHAGAFRTMALLALAPILGLAFIVAAPSLVWPRWSGPRCTP